ncbi:MAG TPA: hypothetical protein DCQ98_02240, partial [Planctomycetaceae bacterium]|nr:hypothetical protein [Planctomycetaceae bacterium]
MGSHAATPIVPAPESNLRTPRESRPNDLAGEACGEPAERPFGIPQSTRKREAIVVRRGTVVGPRRP